MIDSIFKRVSSGDRPNADEHNKLLSAVESLSKRRDGFSYFGQTSQKPDSDPQRVFGVLLTPLDYSYQPLSEPSKSIIVAVEKIFSDSANPTKPYRLGSTSRIYEFVNRSFDTQRAPGTLIKIEWLIDEWSIYWCDCNPSEEGVQLVIDYTALYGTTFGGGGMGSGTLGG